MDTTIEEKLDIKKVLKWEEKTNGKSHQGPTKLVKSLRDNIGNILYYSQLIEDTIHETLGLLLFLSYDMTSRLYGQKPLSGKIEMMKMIISESESTRKNEMCELLSLIKSFSEVRNILVHSTFYEEKHETNNFLKGMKRGRKGIANFQISEKDLEDILDYSKRLLKITANYCPIFNMDYLGNAYYRKFQAWEDYYFWKDIDENTDWINPIKKRKEMFHEKR